MLKSLLKFFFSLSDKFLLLEIYTRNFQDGFLLNLLILNSIKKPKIVEFGAHGHNQGMIGLASHLFLNGKYLLLDGFQNNLNEINLLKKKYDLKNIYTKKFFINPKINPKKLDNFIKNKWPQFKFADLLILDIDGYESKIIEKLDFFRPKIIFFEDNQNFTKSKKITRLCKEKNYIYLGKLDNNCIFSKKNFLKDKINVSILGLSKIMKLFLKLNSKFCLGLLIKIYNKNYEINELINKPNPFNNKLKY